MLSICLYSTIIIIKIIIIIYNNNNKSCTYHDYFRCQLLHSLTATAVNRPNINSNTVNLYHPLMHIWLWVRVLRAWVQQQQVFWKSTFYEINLHSFLWVKMNNNNDDVIIVTYLLNSVPIAGRYASWSKASTASSNSRSDILCTVFASIVAYCHTDYWKPFIVIRGSDAILTKLLCRRRCDSRQVGYGVELAEAVSYYSSKVM